MLDLAAAVAATKDGSLTLAQGVIGRKGGKYFVAVNGSQIACTWIDTITVTPGDKVVALLQQPKLGTGSAIVIGRLTETPRPQYASVIYSPTGSATVRMKDALGNEFEALWLGDTPPAVGTVMALLWQGSTPIALGKRRIAANETDDDVNALKPIAPPKPPVVERYVKAVDSGTWDRGFSIWNPGYKTRVCQGSWGGYGPLTGGWFYGNSTTQLAGCSTLQIYLPARRTGMGRNASASVVFDLISQSSKSSSPNLKGYSHTVSVPYGWDGGWLDLPGSWCNVLKNCGGIAIKGSFYCGFQGIGDNAKSGQLYAK